MSDPVDLLGHALIEPRLNAAEYDYLTAFAQSRRPTRSDDPYAVPANPAAVSVSTTEVGGGADRRGRGAGEPPSPWCPWTPAAGGRVLAPRGVGQGDAAASWLRYLVRHFLAPGGRAAKVAGSRFASFTFDHQLNGVFVARWRRSGRMSLIRVRANRVRPHVLVPGGPGVELWGLLPYEHELDRIRLARSGRRRVGTASDLVYPAVERAR